MAVGGYLGEDCESVIPQARGGARDSGSVGL